MKKYLQNFGKAFLWSLLYSTVIFLILGIVGTIFDDSSEKAMFTPMGTAILAIIFFPILNIPPLLVLCIHKLNKWEVLLECIVFIIFYAFEEDVIFAIVPNEYLWVHSVDVVDGMRLESTGRVWWMQDDMLYVYPLVLTIIFCFSYFGIKKLYQKRHQQKEISD